MCEIFFLFYMVGPAREEMFFFLCQGNRYDSISRHRRGQDHKAMFPSKTKTNTEYY